MQISVYKYIMHILPKKIVNQPIQLRLSSPGPIRYRLVAFLEEPDTKETVMPIAERTEMLPGPSSSKALVGEISHSSQSSSLRRTLVNGRRFLGKRFKDLAAWLKDPYQSFVRRAFAFREGTNDRVIFSEVLDQNEYRLPGKLRPDDIVIDIGAHIGSFCLAAFLRGSRRIYGFEAEGGNYRCACRNLRRLGASVRLYQKAVWRSDRSGDALYHTGYSDAGRNTGGGNVFCHATAATRIDALPLDEVLRDVTRNGQDRVKLVKLDCEMAEFP